MRVVLVIVIAGLSSGCATKRSAGIGIGTGVGLVAAGAVLFAVSPDGHDAPGRGQVLGLGIAGGGLVTIACSVGSLLFHLYGSDFLVHKMPNSPPVTTNPEGRRCEPVARDESTWTCGEGYRCTDDFDDCEPANGLPALRQR